MRSAFPFHNVHRRSSYQENNIFKQVKNYLSQRGKSLIYMYTYRYTYI